MKGNAKCKNSRFEPPFGALRGNKKRVVDFLLAIIVSRTCAFQQAIDELCTLPLSPPKGGTKRDFGIFFSKFQLLSKKVGCKVSSCEHFQRQSCSYIVTLSNGPKMDCGRRPHLPKICAQSDPPPSENDDFA